MTENVTMSIETNEGLTAALLTTRFARSESMSQKTIIATANHIRTANKATTSREPDHGSEQ
jgi:hypothetical protein